MDSTDNNKVSFFPENVIAGIALPERFTFPFYYEPHPLAKLAAEELQQYLEAHTELEHNFGLSQDNEDMPIGKMFGVLVVEGKNGRVGYLSAFSGKLAGSNDHDRFVPPVFDMLTENSFFLQEQLVIDRINRETNELESSEEYIQLRDEYEQLCARSAEEIAAFKKQLADNKAQRRTLREEQKKILSAEEYIAYEAGLVKQSLYDKHLLKVLTENRDATLKEARTKFAPLHDRLEALKEERKQRSAALQEELFRQYTFLDKDGKTRSLEDIFKTTAYGRPPSAAGECATPKLLQYAFSHGYRPLAMAEFWWGASPKSEIRKHKQFYPACAGKCKPILAHMLQGVPMDENPFLQTATEDTSLDIVYEDEVLVVVNKPPGLRSVPGIDVEDSVYSRLRTKLAPIAPIMIHRLDMATSGLIVVAKTMKAHKNIQRQFLERTIKKRYTALLSANIEKDEGEISLPLRGDHFNRPLQVVCFESGKKSATQWKVVERKDGRTRIHFWPLTGRTHQLRVHSAHQLGLNAPILGDDLYGTSADRLYLHAAFISFVHPKTREWVSFEVREGF